MTKMRKPNKGYEAIFALIKAKEDVRGLWYLFPDLPSLISLPKTFLVHQVFSGWKRDERKVICVRLKKEVPKIVTRVWEVQAIYFAFQCRGKRVVGEVWHGYFYSSITIAKHSFVDTADWKHPPTNCIFIVKPRQ